MTIKEFLSLFSFERETWHDLDDKTINRIVLVNILVMFLVSFLCIVLPVLFVYATVQLETNGFTAIMQTAMRIGLIGIFVDIGLIFTAAIYLIKNK